MSQQSGLDADELLVGTANADGLYLAELGVAAPASAVAVWGSGWTPLGYATEDGVSIANGVDSTDINAWQSTAPLRSIITAQTLTVQFQLMQWNPLNLSLYWGVEPPEVTGGAYHIEVNSASGARRRYQLGVDIRDGENRVRYIFPRCELTDVGDQSFTRGDAALLDMTFAALAAEGGTLLDIYGNNGLDSVITNGSPPPDGDTGNGESAAA